MHARQSMQHCFVSFSEGRALTVAQFSAWLGAAFTRQDVLIDAQPEHHLMDMTDPRGRHIVETLGEHIVSFYMSGWDNAREESDDDRRRSTPTLEDGTVLGSVSTAFLDTETGMVAELSVTLPATAAEAIQQHLQHFSIEFRSWMLMASEGK